MTIQIPYEAILPLPLRFRLGHFKRLEIGPSFQLRFKNFQVQTSKRAFLKLRLLGVLSKYCEEMKMEPASKSQVLNIWKVCYTRMPLTKNDRNSIRELYLDQLSRSDFAVFTRHLIENYLGKKPLHFKIIWIFRARNFRVSFES